MMDYKEEHFIVQQIHAVSGQSFSEDSRKELQMLYEYYVREENTSQKSYIGSQILEILDTIKTEIFMKSIQGTVKKEKIKNRKQFKRKKGCSPVNVKSFRKRIHKGYQDFMKLRSGRKKILVPEYSKSLQMGKKIVESALCNSNYMVLRSGNIILKRENKPPSDVFGSKKKTALDCKPEPSKPRLELRVSVERLQGMQLSDKKRGLDNVKSCVKATVPALQHVAEGKRDETSYVYPPSRDVPEESLPNICESVKSEKDTLKSSCYTSEHCNIDGIEDHCVTQHDSQTVEDAKESNPKNPPLYMLDFSDDTNFQAESGTLSVISSGLQEGDKEQLAAIFGTDNLSFKDISSPSLAVLMDSLFSGNTENRSQHFDDFVSMTETSPSSSIGDSGCCSFDKFLPVTSGDDVGDASMCSAVSETSSSQQRLVLDFLPCSVTPPHELTVNISLKDREMQSSQAEELLDSENIGYSSTSLKDIHPGIVAECILEKLSRISRKSIAIQLPFIEKMVHLCSNISGVSETHSFFSALRTVLQYRIFGSGKVSSAKELMTISKFYIQLCLKMKLVDEVDKFVFDCVCLLNETSCVVIDIITNIIPNYLDCGSSGKGFKFITLSSCVSNWLANSDSVSDVVKASIRRVNKMIKTNKCYQMLSRAEILEILLDALKEGKTREVKYYLIIIALQNDFEWSYSNVIVRGLQALVQIWKAGIFSDLPVVCECICLMGYIVRSYDPDVAVAASKDVIKYLTDFTYMHHIPDVVRAAVIEALSCLSFDNSQILKRLLDVY